MGPEKTLLCLTGDHQKFGNHPGSKGVFDMDSIQMLGMVRDMRDAKKFQCGEEIKGEAPQLFLGAAANPFAYPFEFRAVRLGKKIAAGADFIQTQITLTMWINLPVSWRCAATWAWIKRRTYLPA